ncbi:MAG: hypothetical protein LBF26_02545, partial [Puniceicoccales bacterium]|nr:hypothetical protein [Puniceicoccales bacterium]
VAVIDGKELCKNANDSDYAPRRLLQVLLDVKKKLKLSGGTIVPAETANYHAYTLNIPTFDTIDEIEKHLQPGGFIVVGSTNWGPAMHMIISHDKNGKMIMSYGSESGEINPGYALGRCFFYSSNERDVRLYDPRKVKFNLIDSLGQVL